MNSETTSKISSLCPDSVSFPNTRAKASNSINTESKVFKFQPVKSEVLIKQLLEDDEESPISSPKHKTSHISRYRDKNYDSYSSDDSTSNILDKTMIENDYPSNNNDLMPGVSWLDKPRTNKPQMVTSKPLPSTPMSKMFDKLTIKDQSSIRKETRPVSLDRNEEKFKLTPAINNNIFKTPIGSKIITSSSSILQSSEKSAISSVSNQISSARIKRLEIITPKFQKNPSQKSETPLQSSVLQHAIRRNFSTPQNQKNLTEEKICKQNDAILREKNMNEQQTKRDSIIKENGIEHKPQEIKFLPKRVFETKQAVKQSNIIEQKHLNEKQSNIGENSSKPKTSDELKQNLQKHLNEKPSNELKQSNIGENSKPKTNDELKPKTNDEKQPNKKLNVQATIPVKSLQESTFQQLKVRGKDYIVINKIGEGGSGQVYRCLEQETMQDRAIKVVNLNVDSATITSYKNEIKMLQELQGNDRVVKMYDYEQVNQNLFVVMEKGDVDFSNFLKNITNESQSQTHIIICYWIEMLKCVREIHKKGIIHSDLKPSNFLIISGRLKLIDFGIASRLTADMTSVIKNVTVGTFNYISPEALLDSRESPINDEKPHLRISYKSDVWSLGCILYQMVYKKTPFQSVGNMWAKFAMITDKNHKIQYHQVPGVPTYLIEMIKKCLVYDMRSRPTVEELLNMYYNGNYY